MVLQSIKDIYGKPVLLLKISEQRLIYQRGKVSIAYFVLELIISGTVFCGVLQRHFSLPWGRMFSTYKNLPLFIHNPRKGNNR